MALSWTMDKIGPMARSALDCGLIIDVIAGRDPGDPSSLGGKLAGDGSAAEARAYRVGVGRGTIRIDGACYYYQNALEPCDYSGLITSTA